MQKHSSIASSARFAFIGFLAALLSTACATTRFDSFERESEFLYGAGSGASADEALAAAREDLLAAGLAHSLGISPEGFYVTDDMRSSAKLPALKPFIKEKKEGIYRIALRMPIVEWDASELARREAIRSELASRLDALAADKRMPLGERISAAQSIADRAAREGLSGVLTVADGQDELFVDRVALYCRLVVEGLSLSASPEAGLIDDSATFEISLSSAEGLSVAGARVIAEWKAEAAGPDGAAAASERSTLVVGSGGTAALSFAGGEGLSNRRVRLSLSLSLDSDSEIARSLDGRAAASFAYRHFSDIEAAFYDMIRVPGGEFAAGPVAQDRKADRKKEVARSAEVADFLMDACPVTNDLYRAFLEETGAPASAYPDYIDHPDYGAPDQPVIGVRYEDAARFAEWVSARFGKAKRLPTEDEWERAARGGADSIFPWGDQQPSRNSGLANCNGNGLFDGPSPVGSFEKGRNAYGLLDMAGNVWQWTSTAEGSSPGAAIAVSEEAGGAAPRYIVKGGSWMDGPNELRVSNRRGLDPSKGYPDVGFRLVMEVQND